MRQALVLLVVVLSLHASSPQRFGRPQQFPPSAPGGPAGPWHGGYGPGPGPGFRPEPGLRPEPGYGDPAYGDMEGLGGPCHYDDDCDSMEHTYCRNQQTCECKTEIGYRPSPNNDRCLATVGARCSTKYDCAALGTAGECRQGVCDCGANHVPSPDGTCFKAALRLGDKCGEVIQCETLGEGVTCVDNQCQCGPNRHAYRDRCVANHGLHEPCSDVADCYIGEGYQSVITCYMGTCRCREHYVDRGDGKCTAGAETRSKVFISVITLALLISFIV